MTEQHIAILRQLVARAEGADMDVGLSSNILAALLDERADLLARYEALMEGLGLDPSPECYDEYTPDRLRAEGYGLRMLAEKAGQP